MATSTLTTFDADGNQISVESIDVPDAPTAPDLPAIADQVSQLNDAVQMLILNALGGF